MRVVLFLARLASLIGVKPGSVCDYCLVPVSQVSTISGPYSSFHAFSVFWLPPRVSTTSPVLGFL